LADSYEAIRDLKSRLKAALIYPAIVLIVMVLVIMVLIVYVIPKLTEIFVSLNQPLPWHTQFLVNLSGFMRSYWYVVAAIVSAIIIGLRYYLSTLEGQMMLSTLTYKIPVIGKVVKQTELANYMRTLALLISAGVQITEALMIVSKVSNNPQLSNASLQAAKFVEKGNALSDYFRSNTFFDPIISSMAKIGEETGQMDELLYKVADNYANESSYAIKGLSASLEPIILVILGISVGSIVLSVITPIYGLIGNFSQ
jgi:type IV pilus assembly protein PilC